MVTANRRVLHRYPVLRRGLAIAALTLLVSAACSGARPATKATVSGGNGGSGTYGYKIAVVTHGRVGDAFWTVVKNGAMQAGKDMGDIVTYQSNGEATEQAKLIDEAVRQKSDGLVISMADPPALRAAIQRAISAGVDVITINSGTAESKSYGALSHIGSDEPVAGRAVGTQLQKLGVKHVLCVLDEPTNIGLMQRCAGIEATLGGTVTSLQVSVVPADATARLHSALQAHPTIDGVVTLEAHLASLAEAAITATKSNAKLVTFDLNSDIAQAVADGRIEFAVDQQPYLEGYLAVVMMTQYKHNLNVLGGGETVLTGPNLVTKDKAAQVLNLIHGGTW